MKLFTLGLLCIVCMVMLLSPPILAEERPIRILSLYPLSGGFKSSSEQWVGAQKLAVEEVNAQGGLLGRKVELISEDNQMKPEIAVSKAQKYLLEGKADIIIVGGGAVIRALQDLVQQYNVLLLMYGHADEDTGKNFTYKSIRACWNTSMLARATIGYTAKYLKDKKKLYLLNQDYVFGHAWAAAIKKEVARQIPDARFVGEDYHPLMSKDLSPYMTKVKMSGAEALINLEWGLDLSVLLKQRRELGVNAVVVGGALGDPAMIRENPEAAVGARVCDTWFPASTNNESIDFINSWKKMFKDSEHPEPTCLSAQDYIGTKFLFEGIKKAGSTDVAKLIPALESVRYKSITGEVYMRACDHQLVMPLQCVSVDSKNPPYYGVPVTIPASGTTIDEQDVDNPRCKVK